MADSNYQSKWWGYIYDQMMADGLEEWVENNLRFYQASLSAVSGPVLECACGTGIFLLPLLRARVDMHGFDISESMLAALRKKAARMGIERIEERISVQDLESFHYERRFDAILIPTNSFAHLTTQDAQIKTLRNIYTHLAPGGKLLLDLRHPGLRHLVEAPEVEEGAWHTWTHPETGLPIRQRLVGRTDFNNQLVMDRCFIEYEGQAEDFPMTGRWTTPAEFSLLLRLAGFERWQAFGSPDRAPLVLGLDTIHSYWIASKN